MHSLFMHNERWNANENLNSRTWLNKSTLAATIIVFFDSSAMGISHRTKWTNLWLPFVQKAGLQLSYCAKGNIEVYIRGMWAFGTNL